MFFNSQPPLVAEAKKQLVDEPAARKSARQQIDHLWNAAQRLAAAEAGVTPTSAARAAIHLEGVRRALRLLGGLDPTVPDAQVWDRVTPDVTAGLGLSEADSERVAGAVANGTSATEAPTVEALAHAHQQAAAKLNALDRVVGDHDLKRIVRLGFGLAISAAVAVLVFSGVSRLAQPTDLAKGLPFKVSSKMAECHPEQNECGGYPTRVLFHTVEEVNPWYLIDFTQPTAFTRMTIVNRGDMGEGRAIPLVVEVSDDGTNFREIARRNEVFATWKPEVGLQNARYVRVRADRKTWLHLEAVRIHP
jgi:hypothetical protein